MGRAVNLTTGNVILAGVWHTVSTRPAPTLPLSSPSAPSPTPRGRAYAGVGAKERRERRRAAFIAAGWQVMGTVGYHQTTIRALCREAGLTDRYFYESFTNLEHLLLELHAIGLQRVEDAILEAVAACPADQPPDAVLRAALGAFITEFEDRFMARVLWIEIPGVSPAAAGAYRVGVQRFAALLAREAEQRAPDLLPVGPQRELIAIALIGAVSETAVQWLLSDYAAPRGEVEQALVDVCMGVAMVTLARAAGAPNAATLGG